MVIFPELPSYTLKLCIKRKNEKLPEVSAGNRLVWCPYVVDDDDGDDDDDENISEQVLAVNVGRGAEVFDVDMITRAHGDTVDVDNIKNGIVRVQGHTNVSLKSEVPKNSGLAFFSPFLATFLKITKVVEMVFWIIP